MVSMRAHFSFKAGLGFALAAQFFFGSIGAAHNVSLRFQVPSFIQFESASSNLTLPFADFSPGAESETAAMEYRIKANNVTRQRGVLMVQIDSKDSDLDLQARFANFSNAGGTAILVRNRQAFVTLTERDVFLADKTPVSGSGRTIQGSFEIAYKARAVKELPAGTRIKTIKLTFADV